MPGQFLSYLRQERDRLDRELEGRRVCSAADDREVRLHGQLRRIVDDQLARWTRDLEDVGHHTPR